MKEENKRLSPDPDLEALIHELNTAARAKHPTSRPATNLAAAPAPDPSDDDEAAPPAPGHRRWPLPAPTVEGKEWLSRLLSGARQAVASDLLLVAGAEPAVRINGQLEPVGNSALTVGGADMLCAALVPAERRRTVESHGSVDFSLRKQGLGRFRCNVHLERGHWAAAIRLFGDAAPDLDALNLPAGLAKFADLSYGFVLVTGPTGSGKSTTLAALVRAILARRRVHLVAIEDPVEYEHAHGDSVVEHIEIGRDAPTFASALRSVLRQDPDVLLIGEMRDPESMSIAITAAETGHLVLSTLHTGDSPQTIHRILDSYPANQMEAVRAQLSVSLAGIVSQQLLPRIDGTGRVPAVEILMATPAVRNLVRQGKVSQIRSQITLERAAGMLPLDRSLMELVRDGLVDHDEARVRARSVDEFESLLRHSRSG